MIHLFINALAASAGGGLTYVNNVIPKLGEASVQVTMLLPSGFRNNFDRFENISLIELDLPTVRRFWFEQAKLPELIRRSGADVLVSTGNFALRTSPVPQVLLSRNSIYTSPAYFRDLRQRHAWRMLADTYFRSFLAKKSVEWADLTIAPSNAFAAELERWTGVDVITIHHGFDREAFTRDSTPLGEEVTGKLKSSERALKLLFVSHYNYYRNFETLIRSLPIIRDALSGQEVRLLLTCHLETGKNPGAYQPDLAVRLIEDLGVAEMIVELGTIPYQQLHHLYGLADLYVTPAYTETFAHPLVEAMSSGVPIIASDIPVHREICGEAAVYFDRFSPAELAESIVQTAFSTEIKKKMVAAGTKQSELFSWKTHVDKIIEMCRQLAPHAQIKRRNAHSVG